ELSKAESLLEEAVAIEDDLNYNEPPDWFFAVRHHLGAVLLKAGKYEEAVNVYRDDLKIWRKNGWALIGLYNSLVKLGKANEAAEVKAAFEESWQYADLHLVSSSSIMEKSAEPFCRVLIPHSPCIGLLRDNWLLRSICFVVPPAFAKTAFCNTVEQQNPAVAGLLFGGSGGIRTLVQPWYNVRFLHA